MKKCNHIICLQDLTSFFEGYYPIYFDDKHIFSVSNDYYYFNFCPLCGKNLNDLVVERINEIRENNI